MILSHITINTAKLDDSVNFYEKIIGLHIVRDMRGKGPMNIVFLSDERADFCIELVENEDKAYEGTGLSIGFATQDLDKEAEILKEKGIAPGPVISPIRTRDSSSFPTRMMCRFSLLKRNECCGKRPDQPNHRNGRCI